MKQKNLVLIAVAVGCGLVAAVLTAQMSGGQAPVEMVEVPVATKSIAVNTAFINGSMEKMIAMKPIDKKMLPPKAIMTMDQLKDKRLIRAKIAGETFVEADVSSKGTVDLPPGHNMFTIRLSQDEGVGGWAVPGAHVDIIATVEGNVFPLFKNMLIVAIGTSSQAPVNGAMPQIDNVSLAMVPRQTELLALALSRSARFRMALRNPERTEEEDAKAYRWNPTMEQLFTAFDTGKFGEQKETKSPDKKEFVAVKLPVPTEDLPAGTKLTKELIASKFTVMQITPPAPANVIDDIGAHEGQYLLKDLAASQFIPPSYLSETLPARPEAPKNAKPGPDGLAAGPKSAPKIPEVKAPVAPPVYHDVNVVTNGGVRTFRYEVQKDGAYIFLGEIKPGTNKAAPANNKKSEKPASPRV